MRRQLLILAGLLAWAWQAHAAPPAVGGPFALIDQDGRAVTQATFAGKPFLLYFGYTSCPDICPVDLARVQKIADAIRVETGTVLTPVFVTVDPERDTPVRMKAYVRAFGKDMVGLTGTTAQIQAITDEYHVYFKKIPVAGGSYMMDHSTMLFLVGPHGTYLDHYGRKLPDDDVVKRVVTTLQLPTTTTEAP